MASSPSTNAENCLLTQGNKMLEIGKKHNIVQFYHDAIYKEPCEIEL